MQIFKTAILFSACLVIALMSAGPAAANEKGFTIINHTNDVLRVVGKTGDFIFCRVKPRTITRCTCNPLYNKDCFDKGGGKSKVKIVREDPNKRDLWSGDSCFKLYLDPEANIDVSYALDTKHIRCAAVDSDEVKQPLPSFSDADRNKDGVIDKEEAEAIQLKENFGNFDSDLSNTLNPKEFDNAVNKLNIFRGVPF
ncbi:hypothetical protein [Maridesulfovibrio bastinii]|uniref:hypothetical protein n=1 Tax=Maridesulfovibrio bastinii TaxID=47157 RepID=UPI0004256DA2|nr:hypothetical protein [Maridesulfovibrio bastinii]